MTAREPSKSCDPDKVALEIVKGVGGLSVYLNGFRIAGPKPWGGGTTVQTWTVSKRDDIRQALRKGAR